MNRRNEIEAIAAECTDLSVEELEALEKWQLDVVSSVDCNWCDDFADYGYDSIEDAISSAIYAAYEQVTDKFATPDNF